MKNLRPATSTQPQVDPTTTIYGSMERPPLDSANQPEVIPTKSYNSKVVPTVRVKLKEGDNDREMIIDEKDFDPDRHERLD